MGTWGPREHGIWTFLQILVVFIWWRSPPGALSPLMVALVSLAALGHTFEVWASRGNNQSVEMYSVEIYITTRLVVKQSRIFNQRFWRKWSSLMDFITGVGKNHPSRWCMRLVFEKWWIFNPTTCYTQLASWECLHACHNDEVWCSLQGESLLVIKGVISPTYRGYNSSYLFVRPFIGIPYAITPIYNWWRTPLVALAMVNHLFFAPVRKMFCSTNHLEQILKKTWQFKPLRPETFRST